MLVPVPCRTTSRIPSARAVTCTLLRTCLLRSERIRFFGWQRMLQMNIRWISRDSDVEHFGFFSKWWKIVRSLIALWRHILWSLATQYLFRCFSEIRKGGISRGEKDWQTTRWTVTTVTIGVRLQRREQMSPDERGRARSGARIILNESVWTQLAQSGDVRSPLCQFSMLHSSSGVYCLIWWKRAQHDWETRWCANAGPLVQFRQVKRVKNVKSQSLLVKPIILTSPWGSPCWGLCIGFTTDQIRPKYNSSQICQGCDLTLLVAVMAMCHWFPVEPCPKASCHLSLDGWAMRDSALQVFYPREDPADQSSRWSDVGCRWLLMVVGEWMGMMPPCKARPRSISRTRSGAELGLMSNWAAWIQCAMGDESLTQRVTSKIWGKSQSLLFFELVGLLVGLLVRCIWCYQIGMQHGAVKLDGKKMQQHLIALQPIVCASDTGMFSDHPYHGWPDPPATGKLSGETLVGPVGPAPLLRAASLPVLPREAPREASVAVPVSGRLGFIVMIWWWFGDACWEKLKMLEVDEVVDEVDGGQVAKYGKVCQARDRLSLAGSMNARGDLGPKSVEAKLALQIWLRSTSKSWGW